MVYVQIDWYLQVKDMNLSALLLCAKCVLKKGSQLPNVIGCFNAFASINGKVETYFI